MPTSNEVPPIPQPPAAGTPMPDGMPAAINLKMDEIGDPIVKQYIKELFEVEIKEQLKYNDMIKRRKIDTDQIKSLLSEYLDSYIVIGYDIKGARVVFDSAKTDKQMDALIENLRSLFYKIMSGPPPDQTPF